MTPELAGAFYIIIGLSVAIILLAFWCWSLWREIASLSFDLSVDSQYAAQSFYDLAKEIKALDKRVTILEDGVKDLAGHSDLVTQWINLATEKFEGKK